MLFINNMLMEMLNILVKHNFIKYLCKKLIIIIALKFLMSLQLLALKTGGSNQTLLKLFCIFFF